MRPVQLDFLRPAGRMPRVSVPLLAAGILCVLAALGYQRQLAHQVSARQGELQQLRGMVSRSVPTLTERESDTPELREQIKKANAVLQQMNVPWGDLFAAIESAEDGSVALLAVQPDPRGRSVSISGEARGLPGVFAYMGRLERTRRVHDVVLASHEIKLKEAGQPVTFTLNATWQEQR